MKLELKNIAPYLPYGLKMKHYENNRIGNLQGVSTNTLGQPYSLCVNTNWYNSFVYKPILRPLSDLTKEIEVNGIKFKPSEYIDLNFIGFEMYVDDEISFDYSYSDCRGEISNTFELNDVVSIYNKLLEWHFDVFGLIEQKLAIDINTLEL